MKAHKRLMAMVVAIVAALGALQAMAQVVTTTPTPLQEDSQDVVIYFHADQGNKGLMGQPATAALYAHTGVNVVKSDGTESEWQYAPTWGSNLAKYKLEYVSPNLWKLTIGDIRQYYGVAPDETVTKLAFVFRNSNGSKEGKDVGNSDIFVNVVDSGLQVELAASVSQGLLSQNQSVTFSAYSTEKASLNISVNNQVIASATNATSTTAQYTFANAGDYTVTATATNASGSVTSSYEYAILPAAATPTDVSTMPAMGATRNSDGTVTFCIAAPLSERALLVGSWNDYRLTVDQMMKPVNVTIDGAKFKFFTLTLADIPRNEPVVYYYNIDGTAVGDPYARLVLDPWNDKYIGTEIYPELPAYPYDKISGVPLAVFQDNIDDYDWQVTDFKGASKDNLVIYELLLRDFTGTEGKAYGNGTVRQAIDKLPYLKKLGINAIELLPINEFNGNNSWGYNPNFYFAIDKAYGTPADYKEFIDLCHQNGIAVILDVVFNQSDGLHPWYVLYPSGKNPFYNATAPHAYSVLNDWNQGYPLVQQQWDDVLRYWLKEYKVDGFRFDLVKGLGNNDSYASSSDASTNAYNQSRVDRMKRLHDVMREVNPDAYFINENLAGAQEENAMAADGELNWSNVNESGCQYAMGYSSDSSLNRMWAVKDSRTVGSTVAYLESHDEQRLAYKQKMYGVAAVKGKSDASCRRLASAAAQMILVPGSHMIWQFSEMGNAESTKDANGGNNTSPKVVNWSLMDKPANAALVDNYAELINLRLKNQDLFAPSANYTLNFASWSGLRTASATTADKELYLFVNPSPTAAASATATFRTSDASRYQIASQSDGANPIIDYTTKRVTLQPNSYVVVVSDNVDIAGVDSVISDETGLTVGTTGGTIYATADAGATITVYTLSGTSVASGTGNLTISPSPGIYLVNAGTSTQKVVVR